MAASTAGKVGIVTENCESHNCCPADEDKNQPGPSESKDCCKDVVKYFQQKINTTLNPVFKIQPALAVVPGFLSTEKYVDESEFKFDFPDENFSDHHTGKSILIDKQSFLI